MVSAQRFRVVDPAAPDTQRFAVIYEIDADDVTAPIREGYARVKSGAAPISDALDTTTVQSFLLEPLAPAKKSRP